MFATIGLTWEPMAAPSIWTNIMLLKLNPTSLFSHVHQFHEDGFTNGRMLKFRVVSQMCACIHQRSLSKGRLWTGHQCLWLCKSTPTSASVFVLHEICVRALSWALGHYNLFETNTCFHSSFPPGWPFVRTHGQRWRWFALRGWGSQ